MILIAWVYMIQILFAKISISGKYQEIPDYPLSSEIRSYADFFMAAVAEACNICLLNPPGTLYILLDDKIKSEFELHLHVWDEFIDCSMKEGWVSIQLCALKEAYRNQKRETIVSTLSRILQQERISRLSHRFSMFYEFSNDLAESHRPGSFLVSYDLEPYILAMIETMKKLLQTPIMGMEPEQLRQAFQARPNESWDSFCKPIEALMDEIPEMRRCGKRGRPFDEQRRGAIESYEWHFKALQPLIDRLRTI